MESIGIAWSTPTPDSEPISYYNVTVINDQEKETQIWMKVSSTHAVCEILKANTHYTIFVRASARHKDCGLAFKTAVWTLPEGRLLLI